VDPVAFTIGYFVLAYGWPIYLPVLVLIAGTLFGAVLFAVVGAIRTGFRRSDPAADDVDVAEFFEAQSR
jgi:ABC-type thiamin/hydroxymethylpyrimidine transport system permease subunit